MILGIVATMALSPILVLLAALSHYHITSGNFIEYRLYFHPVFQLIAACLVGFCLLSSLPVFFYMRKKRLNNYFHTTFLGAGWGVLPGAYFSISYLEYEGWYSFFEVLLTFVLGGSIIFFTYWMISMRKNKWWEASPPTIDSKRSG